MGADSSHEHDDQKKSHHAEHHAEHATFGVEAPISGESALTPSESLLGNSALTQRANTPVRVAAIQRMQRRYGNRATRQFLQRYMATSEEARSGELANEESATEGADAGETSDASDAAHATTGAVHAQREADPNFAGPELSGLPTRGATVQRMKGGLIAIQRDVTGQPETAHGKWDITGIKKEGALNTPPTPSGIDISLKFKAKTGAPYSNKIGIVQIIKVTSPGGANLPIASLPTLPATRRNALLTGEDKGAGVEKGYFTDVLHRDFGPGRPNTDSPQRGDQTQNYQGGVPVFGFKRSDDDADIKSAEITDFPGTSSNAVDVDFGFETVARGDDVQQIYGAVKWAFGLRAGKVVNESGPTPSDAGSATFGAAVEKHRDFYRHEPVSFYFDFDSSTLSATEIAKIDAVLPYITRNADVTLSLQGFADQRGKADYNRQLAQRRSDAVAQALRDKGVANARITVAAPGGATTQFTTDATTDQDRDPNRRGNRVVVLTFVRTPIPVTP